MIAQLHMARECSQIRHDDVIAQFAVVGDVTVGHDHAVVADPGSALSCGGTPVDGHVFPDLVAIADNDLGGLALVVQILWGHADGGKGTDEVIPADGGAAAEHRVAH